jgi:DNA replication protein DnaC
MGDIRTRYLCNDAAERLYRNHPQLGRSWEKYCPTCNKTGTYFWRGQDNPCDCEYQLQLHKWYLASGIGVTYQRLDWDDYVGPAVHTDQIEKYLLKRDQFLKRGLGLYFSGSFGSGKTMLANLVIKELVKDGLTCWATTFSQTVEMFTAGWSDRVEKDYFQQKFINSQVLLLDDVGKELRGTRIALAETTFDAILRQRVQAGRATFITTNMDSTDLEQGYGAAILSLVREKSLDLVFNGGDFRPTANSREITEVLRGEVRPVV